VSVSSQASRRYRLSKERRRLAVASEAHDAVVADAFLPPTKGRDGVWRQAGARIVEDMEEFEMARGSQKGCTDTP